jgi:hypothetical protein
MGHRVRDCILAPGRPGNHGYHRITRGNVTKLAHRVTWEDSFGPIQEGMEIHHLCGNKWCINIDHLAVMTTAAHRALHGRREVCLRGHLRTPDNVNKIGACRECARAYEKARWIRRKAARAS